MLENQKVEAQLSSETEKQLSIQVPKWKSQHLYHHSVWSFELLWLQSNQTTMVSLSENIAP